MYVDDRTRLEHMLDAAQKAAEFVQGHHRADLDTNPMLLFALIRAFEIIGEAAHGISEDFRLQHQEIPWDDIISMRNHLIHGYFIINMNIVWETSSKDIPDLLEHLHRILAEKS